MVRQFLIGVSLVVISACGGGGSSGGDDDKVAAAKCGTGVFDLGIDPDSMVDGCLEDGDRLAVDIESTSTNPSYADEYRFTITVDGTITIDVSSADFDTSVALLIDGTETVIAANDDVIGSTNSQLTFSFVTGTATGPGTYIIAVLEAIKAGSVAPTPVPGEYSLETVWVP